MNNNNCYNCVFSVVDELTYNCECKLLEKAYNYSYVYGDRINCPLFCDRDNTINIFIKVHKKQFKKNKDLYLLGLYCKEEDK